MLFLSVALKFARQLRSDCLLFLPKYMYVKIPNFLCGRSQDLILKVSTLLV